MKLKDLPDHLLGLAIRRHVEDRDRICERTEEADDLLDADISAAFVWWRAPEGEAFWSEINRGNLPQAEHQPAPETKGECTVTITCSPEQLQNFIHVIQQPRGCA